MKSSLLSISVLVLFIGFTGSPCPVGAQEAAGTATAAAPPRGLPPNVQFIPDLVYAQPNGTPLKLDLYLPQGAAGPVPLVIFVHGGGWYSGNKSNPLALPLAGQGFAVASIDYRLTGAAPWPAQIFDCKAAVRWLRANAAKYNINPDKIGAFGTSAGAHLVELLGTTAGHPELEGDEGNPGVSSAVQAVCAFAGPANLLDIYDQGLPGKRDILEHQGIARLLGGPTAQNLDKARAASPITYVGAGDPPFLLIHGDHDPSVPLQQSVEFCDALKKAGVDAALYVVKGGLHVPRDMATRQHAIDFFKEKLR